MHTTGIQHHKHHQRSNNNIRPLHIQVDSEVNSSLLEADEYVASIMMTLAWDEAGDILLGANQAGIKMIITRIYNNSSKSTVNTKTK